MEPNQEIVDLNSIWEIVRKFSNNMELGEEIRRLYFAEKEKEKKDKITNAHGTTEHREQE